MVTDKRSGLTSKFFQGLGFRLSFFLGLIYLGSILGFSLIYVSYQEKRAISDVLLDANRFSDTLKHSMVSAMRTGHRETIETTVEALADRNWIELVRIINKDGLISYTTKPQEIGERIEQDHPACIRCHSLAPPPRELPLAERSRIWKKADGSRRVEVVTPILNSEGCSASPCHLEPGKQKVLGILDVVMSLDPVDRAIAHHKRNFLLLALGLFLLVTTVSGWLIRSSVLKPLSELASSAQETAAGKRTEFTPGRSKDEIGALAAALDEMRKRITQKTALLEKSRNAYQTLFERVPCYITVQDRDLKLVTYNRQFAREFGPVDGEYCYQAYKRRDAPCENCMVVQTMEDGQVHSNEEVGIGKDGQRRYFLVHTAPIRNEQGEIVSVMEMSTDITAVRLLQEELRRSELKYRIIFNNAPNPIFVLDPETFSILDANERAVQSYGYSREAIRGMSFLELSSPEDRSTMSRCLEEGGDISRITHKKEDGSILFVNVRVSPSEYGGQRVLIVTTDDITEGLQTEQQLIQAAKMATLGEMATGVAHELNQPLSVIKTAANVLLKRVAQNRDIGPDLLSDLSNEIDSQVDRASLIINHMREFGRKPEIKKQPVNLNEAIRDAFTLIAQQLKLREIEVALDLTETPAIVLGDKHRLEQVFVNLVLNARDAIEAKKAHSPMAREANRISIRSFPEQEQVVVAISDTGTGIPEHLRRRVFEPFFTTKEVGKGTGLGLSISYGIIRDYEGTIDIESEVGTGTTFIIRLPLYAGAASQAQP